MFKTRLVHVNLLLNILGGQMQFRRLTTSDPVKNKMTEMNCDFLLSFAGFFFFLQKTAKLFWPLRHQFKSFVRIKRSEVVISCKITFQRKTLTGIFNSISILFLVQYINSISRKFSLAWTLESWVWENNSKNRASIQQLLNDSALLQESSRH